MTGGSFIRFLGAALVASSAAFPALAASILPPDEVNFADGRHVLEVFAATRSLAPSDPATDADAPPSRSFQIAEQARVLNARPAAVDVSPTSLEPKAAEPDATDAASPSKARVPVLPKAETVVLFGMGLSAAVANSMRRNWIA